MYDTVMTIVGNVVDEPRMRYTKNHHAVATFRIASTSRRYDREQGRFVDDSTLFVNVSCWRALAENTFDSLHKGQRVIVSGRYYQREYTTAETKRIRYELEANAIGHDLSWGTTRFTKVHRPPVTGTVESDGSGAPVDDADAYLASLDRDEAAQITAEAFDGELDAGDLAEPTALPNSGPLLVS